MAQKSLALQNNPSGQKKKVGWEKNAASALDAEDEDDQIFGFKREKSECKLL